VALSRKYEDILVDNLLLLYIISKGTRLGRTKLQKLAYLVECKLGKEKLKTFNYNFKRWDYGTFTKEIFEDSERLVENDIITDHSTRPTERGEEILDQTKEIFEDNKEIFNEIDKIIYKYNKLPLNDLLDAVYESKVELDGKLIKIKDVSLGRQLNTNISEEESVDKIKISDEWLETLDILFDKEFSSSLDEACEDAKEGKFYTDDEVFSDV